MKLNSSKSLKEERCCSKNKFFTRKKIHNKPESIYKNKKNAATEIKDDKKLKNFQLFAEKL